MERDKTEEDTAVVRSDKGAGDVPVDHQRLARLVARSEASTRPTNFAHTVSIHRSPLIKVVVGILLLVGCGVGAYFIVNTSRKPNVLPTSNNGGDVNQDGNNAGNVITKQGPMPVTGGTFQMGRTGGAVQEGPPHVVTVDSFAMDKTEVTNAEYADFVRETNHTPPSHWGGTTPVAGQEQWAVGNVSFEDATAFAEWRTKREKAKYRLPTEQEWEYAARGGDQGNLYPWGNIWIRGRTATRDAGLATLAPVGSYPDGKARWGQLDMIGNVWEWTSSLASYYPGSDLTTIPEHKSWVIIRGGSLASDPQGRQAITNCYRDWIQPTTKNDLLGFRLVREDSH